MTNAANMVVALVAILHVWFMVLEMFFWRKPLGLKTFHMTQPEADSSAVLAANQGLYNGFLAAGLAWSLWINFLPAKVFFLICILVAGVFGGLTARRSILVVQALPALLGLLLVYAER
jgi:putative membrane protein